MGISVNIDEFNENGFIVVPQLVSKEQIQTLFKHIENLLDETLALTNIHNFDLLRKRLV